MSSDGAVGRTGRRQNFSSHLVHLDAGVDALSVQRVDEGSAVGARLVKGLLEKDSTADVLPEVGSRDEELAVTATVLLDVLDTNTLEARPAQVALDSSIARMPLPGIVILVCIRGWMRIRERMGEGTGGLHRQRDRVIPQSLGLSGKELTAVSRSSSSYLPALVTIDARLA